MSRYDYHKHYECNEETNEPRLFDDYLRTGCERCRANFDKVKSVCGFCCQPVSNKTYLSGDYHQTGKCRARLVYREPERTVDKPMTSPSAAAELGKVDYNNACNCKGGRSYRANEFMHFKGCERYIPAIETYHDLAVWWGLTKPRKEVTA